ncbi:unnamed protein product [Paramecium sonneborni]|uniref:C2 domain-containing protein n=1 Tax=Paramecium sonneborni TaxID=65129 RepID=A0A8S1K7M2_9CILI|nr:unnamed protein product [Paramecium sonneborni]
MNQIQTHVIHQIFQQAHFQNDQLYPFQDFISYLNSLINQQFPFEIIEPILQDENPTQLNLLSIHDFANIILQEFQSQIQIKQNALDQIQIYKNEYSKLLDEFKVAKQEESLNQYQIDIDSTLFITVSHAECLKSNQYFVTITLFNESKNTQISNNTNHPIWQEEFKIHVTSPHGQIIIELFNQSQVLIGQLKLPLYQFKDQQSSNLDYLLEDQHGVLINTKLKLNLTIWWIHSKVALLQDQIIFVDEYKKEINEQQQIIQKCNNFIDTCVLAFDESRIIKIKQHPQEVCQEPDSQEQWTNKFQTKMYQIAKQFKNEHQDSLEEWQQIVLILNGFVTIFTLVLISLARPYFQQLSISLFIGMLILTYDSEHIKTSKILPQISLILLIQCIFDGFWLIVNYRVWWSCTLIFEQQLFGSNIMNYISYYCTIIILPINLILTACSFNLSLKYLAQNNIEL